MTTATKPIAALPLPKLNPNGRVMYFAFGSNLDHAQMRKRCPAAQRLWPASLDGYRLAFVGFSRGWGGGVATIVPSKRGSVEGYVYDLTPACVRSLDGYEGAPIVYSREAITMLDDNDTAHACIVYTHNRPHIERKPSDAYASKIRAAYEREGFDAAPLLAAIKRAPRRKAAPRRPPAASVHPRDPWPFADPWPDEPDEAQAPKHAPPRLHDLPLFERFAGTLLLD